MASLRRKFTISWNNGEPVEILTSARDVVNSSQYTNGDAVAATFGLLYAALVRLGHEPPPFEEWLDLVDEVEDIGTAVVDIAGPTSAAPSVGALSPSPV